jgi:hypothetical protein
MTRRYAVGIVFFAAALFVFISAGQLQAQAIAGAEPPASFDAMIDKTIARENALLTVLQGAHPVAETYIQEMAKDTDFGFVPKTDHYFLGKVDLSKGVATDSFMPKPGFTASALAAFTQMFSLRFLPRGFAQMMIMDGNSFDRGHYDFKLIRREFLGDVGTWVVSVSPKPEAGSGRFNGRIWIEDKGYSIVRFNGTYGGSKRDNVFLHFDSWRINCGPDLWVPYQIYSEETELPYDVKLRHIHYKSMTQLWGYTQAEQRNTMEFTNMTVDLPSVRDNSAEAADYTPVESLRNWSREAEDNILGRLESANLVDPSGPVEKILDIVVNNILVTNDLHITPDIRTRVMLTTPLETFTIGNTIVISRGLLDTLPDEASLAAILAHEVAHIALGHSVDTKFAFGDRTNFSDEDILKKFRFARPQNQEDAANEEAVKLLEKSPYNDKLRQAGLFLKALGAESNRLPNLIKPLMGSRMAEHSNVLRLAALLETAPELQRTRPEQVAALPLGGRTRLDPWTDELRMSRTRSVPLLSAREKMPFEVVPVYLHLTYGHEPERVAVGSEPAPTPPQEETAPSAPVNSARARER